MSKGIGEDSKLDEEVPTGILKPTLFGLLVIGLFFVGFGYWAIRAPLAGAAIAPGVVVASGKNQEIQHFEGGIIREISVKQGGVVAKGQPLVQLDPTQAQASSIRISKTLISMVAHLERSKAELADKQKLEFPEELSKKAIEAGIGGVLAQQEAEFTSRMERHNSQLSVLDEQISAVEEEISGIKLQIKAEQKKLVIIDEELKAKKDLLDQGLTPKNQYNTLLRAQADMEGAIGSLTARIGQRKKSISEAQERQVSLRAERKIEASAELNNLRPQVDDLQQQLVSRMDILNRMIIRAPVDGVIVSIAKNTIGSIIRPGETVLEILPTSDELIISARVSPQDVDIITVGQQASIRFSALNASTTPEVPASVEYVSADRLLDEASQEPYFDARLKLSSILPDEIKPEQIYPGMPVEAFIKTGDRTFLEYLVRPISDSFSKAFREE